jgi:7-carboxy-7-deazaguanine synthase
MDIAELFESIQGESTYAGLGCFFIRLAGCNLRCVYCDTPEARDAGQRLVSVDQLVAKARDSRMPLIEVTGGEPLLQEGFPELAEALLEISGRTILVETNGSLDLRLVPEGVVSIVDIKCPGSGAGGSFDMRNLAQLRADDEVKLVLMDRTDYEWARVLVQDHELVRRVKAVHFSPVAGELDAATLGTWILEDGLDVRLQVQLHKLMGLK